MLRKFFSFLIISTFFLTGCSNQIPESDSSAKNHSLSTSYKENITTNNKIILSGKTLTNYKYIYLGNLLFFPDPNNNNKLSVSELAKSNTVISQESIIDIFDYSIDYLISNNDIIYFSSISKDRGLFKLDYQKNTITKLNNDSPKGLIYANEKLYYIDSNTQNIYSYDVKSNSKSLLSTSKVGNFIINNNSIFYRNLDDNSKLYCLKIDGSSNIKLTDDSVDSFVTYNNEILFVNSSDNNTLHSFNILNSESKKILNVDASKLKQSDERIYFINNASANTICQLTKNKENNDYTFTEIFSDSTNEYFPTDKGIFIETSANINEVKFISIN